MGDAVSQVGSRSRKVSRRISARRQCWPAAALGAGVNPVVDVDGGHGNLRVAAGDSSAQSCATSWFGLVAMRGLEGIIQDATRGAPRAAPALERQADTARAHSEEGGVRLLDFLSVGTAGVTHQFRGHHP